MADEETLLDQVKAMEAWALEALEKVTARPMGETNITKAIEVLQNLNRQGRKVEWRSNGRGIRDLPTEIPEVQQLHQELSSARAGALQVIEQLKEFVKLWNIISDKKQFNNKQTEALLNKAAKFVKSITVQMENAREVMRREIWLPKNVIVYADWFPKVAPLILNKKGCYRHLDLAQLLPRLQKANLAGADLEGVNLSGANLQRANLTKAKLAGANLEKANLTLAQLSEVNLDGASLTEAVLTEAILTNASLKGAQMNKVSAMKVNASGSNLDDTTLTYGDFREALLDGASLKGARITGCVFSGVQLRANLEEVNGTGVVFDNASMSGARLLKAKLKNCSFKNINGSGMKAMKATIIETDFFEANLSNADFGGTDLSKSKFKYTKLAEVNMKKANLQEASFEKTSLYNVSFVDADLRNAKLRDAGTLKDSDFRGADLRGSDINLLSYEKKQQVKNLDKAILDK